MNLWLIEIVEVGGIENNISESRLTQAIQIAFGEYLNIFTLADIKLFCDFTIKGKLIDTNNNAGYFIKMNARTLSVWVQKYISARMEYAKEESINEASNYKESTLRDGQIKTMREFDYKFKRDESQK